MKDERSNYNFLSLGKKIAFYAVCIVIVVFSLTPIFWMFTSAFKPESELFVIPPVWISSKPIVTHFVQLFLHRQYGRFLGNSLVCTIIGTLGGTIIGTLGGYGLARIRTKRSEAVANWILSIRMLPPIVAALPIYLMFTGMGLYDKRISLYVIYIMFNLPFTIWIMRGFFEEIPLELEEAAMLDGCSQLDLFFKIVLPLVLNGIFVVIVFNFILCWNEFLFAFLLTGRSAKTLPVGITGFITERGTLWGEASAAESVMVIPVLILVLLSRKFLVRAMSFGLLK